MLSFSEWTLNILIWSLTGAGFFFGGRAYLPRRKERNDPNKKDDQ